MKLQDLLKQVIATAPSLSAAARLLNVANPTPKTWLKTPPAALDAAYRAAEALGYEILIVEKKPAPRD